MRLSSFLSGILLVLGVYEVRQASSSIATEDILATLNLQNCDDFKHRLKCSQLRYRTFDGTCNNLCQTSRGATFRPHRRLPNLDPPTDYEQPGNLPRRVAADGTDLPNARKVSVTVFRSNNGNLNMTAPNFTHVTMTWGQFIDHDVTLTEFVLGVECGVNDEPCVVKEGCIGIPILAGNQLTSNLSAQCIPLRRSFLTDQGEQINLITSYIDGSQVYGSCKDTAMRLRNQKANLGLLDVRPFINSGGMPILPPDEETFCRSPNPEEAPCFLAGDVRVNENQALMAMHLLWVREHNRIAKYLHILNPYWGDERLFQEARKIVAAEIQHITYNEWLAVLFSKELRDNAGLSLVPDGQFFTGYDPTVNPEMINSFSTAAFRFGHSLIRNAFALLDRRFSRQGFGEPTDIPTRDFFNAERFFRPGNNAYGGILLGLIRQLSQQIDPNFVEAVREQLIIEGPTFDGIVGDLPAINIQRGRDHGLPGYVKFREACGARPANNFYDLSDTITLRQRTRLQEVYDSVHDIDLFAGAMSEFPAEGSALGFTFTCILTRQFQDLRLGDRFWYERDTETAFTAAQLTELRKCSLARVMCDNTDGVSRIQRQAFLDNTDANGANPTVDCEDVPFVNLNVFKEGSDSENASAGGEANAAV